MRSDQLDPEHTRFVTYQKQAVECICKECRSREDEVTLTDQEGVRDLEHNGRPTPGPGSYFNQDLKRRKGTTLPPFLAPKVFHNVLFGSCD